MGTVKMVVKQMSDKKLKFGLKCLNEHKYEIIEKETGKNALSLLQELHDENEKLRQQQQRLYNYFRDYLADEMSAENFGEMWDNVKEDERWTDG